MLQVSQLDVYYGDVQVLRDITFDVADKELVAVVGANGAGKTTLLNTISGLLRARKGVITFDGKRLSGMPAHEIVQQGVIQVPEGRLLFPDMTVQENLEMGGFRLSDPQELAERLDSVFRLFPILKERAKQLAGTLSGGEQQMLAIGRGLMSKPKLLMLDEPSLGLAPKIVQQIFDLVLQINKEMEVTVLLVEQNVKHSCQISDRAIVIENGEVVLQGPGPSMLENDHVRRAYLGL